MTTQPQPDASMAQGAGPAHLRAAIKDCIEKLDRYCNRQGKIRAGALEMGADGVKHSTFINPNPNEGQHYPAVQSCIDRAKHALQKHFPAPPALTHEQIMEACEESSRRMNSMTKAERAELEGYARSIIATGKPPALTGGDAELVACLLAANPKGSDKERSMDAFIAKQAAARITTLSAQVAELTRANEFNLQGCRELLDRCYELEDCHADAQERIAELERDKALLDSGRILLSCAGERCEFVAQDLRAAINAAMNLKQP